MWTKSQIEAIVDDAIDGAVSKNCAGFELLDGSGINLKEEMQKHNISSVSQLLKTYYPAEYNCYFEKITEAENIIQIAPDKFVDLNDGK